MSEQLPHNFFEGDGLPLDDRLDGPWSTTALLSLLMKEENLFVTFEEPLRASPEKAAELVQKLDADLSNVEAIFELLKSVVKPLFTVPNSAITSAGRRNEYPKSIPKYAFSAYSDDAKPWKSTGQWSLPLLDWTLVSLEASMSRKIAQNTEELQKDRQKFLSDLLPLLAPPVLQLIDDGSLAAKSFGSSLLRRFSGIISMVEGTIGQSQSPEKLVSTTIFARTGLATVFLDALAPSFLILPTLTPEDESLFVLKRTYSAYIAVVEAAFPQSPANSGGTGNVQPDERVKYLNKMQAQILSSMAHLAEAYPGLQTFLLTQLAVLVRLLGAHTALHLRQILVMCRETMRNPFASGDVYIPVLSACVDVYVEICKVVPERVDEAGWWCEILRGMVAAWTALDDAEEEPHALNFVPKVIEVIDGENEDIQEKRKRVRHQLRCLAMRLMGLMENITPYSTYEHPESRTAFKENISEILDEEPSLRGLFIT